MIGIVIPAHNEQERIGACLASIQLACAHAALRGEAIKVVVVLDDCDDDTALIAAQYPVMLLSCTARNVGIARARGAAHLIEAGARWLAFTDADSCVAPDWLSAQLSFDADVVCGTVEVADWPLFGDEADLLRGDFQRHYQDADDHRHVHGANLGLSTQAYLRAGGFAPLACSEDQVLVDTLAAQGARIAWTALPRVRTSARQDPRAAGGFGDTLKAALLRCRQHAADMAAPVADVVGG